jgi:DNA processing protein
MDDTELLDRLRLMRTNHIGPITCQLLSRRYGRPAAALQAIPELSANEGRKLNLCRRDKAEKEL